MWQLMKDHPIWSVIILIVIILGIVLIAKWNDIFGAYKESKAEAKSEAQIIAELDGQIKTAEALSSTLSSALNIVKGVTSIDNAGSLKDQLGTARGYCDILLTSTSNSPATNNATNTSAPGTGSNSNNNPPGTGNAASANAGNSPATNNATNTSAPNMGSDLTSVLNALKSEEFQSDAKRCRAALLLGVNTRDLATLKESVGYAAATAWSLCEKLKAERNSHGKK